MHLSISPRSVDDIAALITLITRSISPLSPRTNILENIDTSTAGHKYAGGTQTPLITAAISSQGFALAQNHFLQRQREPEAKACCGCSVLFAEESLKLFCQVMAALFSVI